MMVHGTSLHGLSDADTLRMAKAFTALAHELDVRTGAVPREPRRAPVDPAQQPLFDVDREEDHGQEAVT